MRLCFTGMGWLEGKLYFLTSQIGYLLNFFFKTDYRMMQVKSIAECSQGAFCNTFDLHLVPICLNPFDVYFLLGWSYCIVVL